MHPYLATDCIYNIDNSNANNSDNTNDDVTINSSINEVGGRDTEKQNIQILAVTDIKTAVLDGRFVEVQWSNTVALAMLHLS